MLDVEDKTEKLHVLVVLEDGSFKDARETRAMLKKHFDLTPSKDAVRKHLERCCDQGLLARRKFGRSYCYKIVMKGRERLRIIRVKREEKPRRELDKLTKDLVLERLLDMSERHKKKWLLTRMVEVTSSLRLCDALLNRLSDENTLSLARNARMYWELEYSELIPYVSGELVKMVENVSEQLANAIEKMWKRSIY